MRIKLFLTLCCVNNHLYLIYFLTLLINLLFSQEKFAGVDIRVRVNGGGHVAQIYAIRQAISKALVAFYQKCKHWFKLERVPKPHLGFCKGEFDFPVNYFLGQSIYHISAQIGWCGRNKPNIFKNALTHPMKIFALNKLSFLRIIHEGR